jgi:hypothetical protein
MTDEQDDQSSSQDAQDASQETSNQGTSISFDVQGDVPAISQPKSMACWATVTTMNMSWKNQQSYSIESAMDSLGSDFRKIFDDNTGLAPNRVQDLSDPTGMKSERRRKNIRRFISRLYHQIRSNGQYNRLKTSNDALLERR